MNNHLSYRLLIVEDSSDDVLLVVAELERAGLHIKYDHVETIGQFERALMTRDYDAVLCDHRLPEISSVNVLSFLKRSGKTTPLFIVSGVIALEVAKELIKLGAADFVMKDNLNKLPELLRTYCPKNSHKN